MNIAVVFAGGTGQRMKSQSIPKQFLEVNGKPILVQTIEHFQKHDLIDGIVVVCIESWMRKCRKMIDDFRLTKVVKVIPGAETAQLSSYEGVKAAYQLASGEKSIVLVHDGVRPLINEELIGRNISEVKQYGSSITCAPAKETVTLVSDNETVEAVYDRSHLRLARAPQCFWLDELVGAYRKAVEIDHISFIDSCTMMEYYGYPLHMTEGPDENIKITTQADYRLLRAMLQMKEDRQFDENN